TMSNFVLQLDLKTEIWQEHIIEKRLNIGRQIYNSVLSKILKRDNHMKNSNEYITAVKMEKGKDRNKKLNDIRKDFKLTKFDMNKYVKPMGQKYKKNLGSQMVQEIAERAYSAYEKVIFSDGKKIHFKKYGEFNSLREKGNITGLRYYENENMIKWLGLNIPVIIKRNDKYAIKYFESKLKYCKLLKKVIRGKNRYFVQITFEGTPPNKRNINYTNNEVGIDIGTSTIAIVSDEKVEFKVLADSVDKHEEEKVRLQRKLDRQRRANNPNKYNKDGTINIKNKDKWIKSKNYIKTNNKLKEINRKIADKRTQSHNILSNEILELGTTIKVETMNYKALQSRAKETKISEKTGKFKKKKRFGSSLLNRAPSRLLTILDNKLKNINKELIRIDTIKVKASQYNHETNEYTKVSLNTRWKTIGDIKVQRDMYSAYLIKCV
ncbi:transposase, partial [Oceanivirga salmonicida]|uniref:transposase n=1 Tax=Oceanivirga salmonicida TaxID=1769291 RepID=UPI0018CC5E0D